MTGVLVVVVQNWLRKVISTVFVRLQPIQVDSRQFFISTPNNLADDIAAIKRNIYKSI